MLPELDETGKPVLTIEWTLETWVLLLAAAGIFLLAALLTVLLQAGRQRALLQQLQEYRLQESDHQHQLDKAGADVERLEWELDSAREELHLQQAQGREQLQQFHQAEKQREALKAGWQALNSQLQQLQQVHQALQSEHLVLASEHAALEASQQEREEHYRQQLQQLNDSRQALTKEFENLANRIFEEKGQSFARSSQSNMDALLKPFREQIEGFQKRVNEVHDVAVQGNASLNAEIRKVLEAGMQMSADAHSLVAALKGDSQQRGAWGEAQLKRTLELGGLIEGEHYQVQTSLRDEQGRLKQTDFLISLPDGKQLVIDSKVTLVAYEQLVTAQTDEEKKRALTAHLQAVRRHVDELTDKDYSSLPGVHAPGFVLMFMPVEPAFIEALRQDRELYEYALRKNVVLVSHTTLIPVLRTVSSLWMLERSQQEAREISDRAGDIYNQVCLVAERLARLGNTLGTVSNHYNSVVTSLAGQQGLHGKVERFAQLSARVNKSMPELEPRHPDYETGRLQLDD